MKRYALFALVMLLATSLGCGNKTPTEPDDSVSVTFSDLTVGTGTTATSGRFLTVNYTGWLQDTTKTDGKGTMFDTSIGKSPYSFFLGFGQVIPGWDLGIPGMKVGGKRLLIVPPALAYGSQTNGPIPGNSTLVFEVELLNVQ